MFARTLFYINTFCKVGRAVKTTLFRSLSHSIMFITGNTYEKYIYIYFTRITKKKWKNTEERMCHEAFYISCCYVSNHWIFDRCFWHLMHVINFVFCCGYNKITKYSNKIAIIGLGMTLCNFNIDDNHDKYGIYVYVLYRRIYQYFIYC